MIIKGNANHTIFLMISLILIGFAALIFDKISLISFVIAEVVIIAIVYFFSGLRLFYYMVEEKSITVKNLFYWWYDHKVSFDRIKKVKIYRRVDGNLIVIIDSYKYISNNLSKEDVNRFISVLKSKGMAIEEELL